MPQLLAILDEGGRTLLVKTLGDIQAPSFPTLGLLCSIASFGSSKGYVVQAFGTDNVQIVYEGFHNHLLLVLATSNKLVSRELLHGLLQAVYAGIQMCVGRQVLASVEMKGVEQLRMRLRGMPWIEHLIGHDALFPCTMLPGPQWLGLSPDDKATVSGALSAVAAAVPVPLAALMREGLYLVATPAWRALPPMQQLLLQHLGCHQGPKGEHDHAELPMHVLDAEGQEQLLRLVMVRVMEGGTLMLLCGPGVTVASILATVAQHAHKAEPVLQHPAWSMLPVPQYSSVTFDLAAVVRLPRPACAHVTLYWGYRRLAAGATRFNPMSSPTVRKQMSSPASAASVTRRALSSSGGAHSSEALQLFFKASCDLLAAFMLSSHPPLAPCARAPAGNAALDPSGGSDRAGLGDGAGAAQEASWGHMSGLQEPALHHKPSIQSRPSMADSEAIATPRTAMAAFAQRFFSSFVGSISGSPRAGTSTPRNTRARLQGGFSQSTHANGSHIGLPHATTPQVQESQMLTEGKRLVAVVDASQQQSVSVFLVCSESTDRQTASQAAREMRSLCIQSSEWND